MKKLLAAFQKSSSEEEHSTLANTLHHSGVNVFTLCAGGGGSCLLAALYRWGEVHVSSEYLGKCHILFPGDTATDNFSLKDVISNIPNLLWTTICGVTSYHVTLIVV